MTARNTLPMDPKLLAILTGELGYNSRVGKICSDLGAVFTAFLPDLIETETNLKFTFAYEYCETGLKDDLIHDLDDYMVLVDGSLKNWCTDFTIACPSQVIVAMVECLLGDQGAGIENGKATVAGDRRALRCLNREPGVALGGEIEGIFRLCYAAVARRDIFLTLRHIGNARPVGIGHDVIELELRRAETDGVHVGEIVGDGGHPPVERYLRRQGDIETCLHGLPPPVFMTGQIRELPWLKSPRARCAKVGFRPLTSAESAEFCLCEPVGISG